MWGATTCEARALLKVTLRMLPCWGRAAGKALESLFSYLIIPVISSAGWDKTNQLCVTSHLLTSSISRVCEMLTDPIAWPFFLRLLELQGHQRLLFFFCHLKTPTSHMFLWSLWTGIVSFLNVNNKFLLNEKWCKSTLVCRVWEGKAVTAVSIPLLLAWCENVSDNISVIKR